VVVAYLRVDRDSDAPALRERLLMKKLTAKDENEALLQIENSLEKETWELISVNAAPELYDPA
jgi:hypothetical protein